MSIRLTGILVDGLNNPLVNTTVTLIARSNTLLVLGGSEAVFRTDSTGHYNILVNSGHYVVIVGPQGTEPYKAGEIVLYADSADGSLNGYLVNWVEEELTPDIIKQVQDLVASSQEYALQAERAASSANSDATDARNSKAAAASSASSALTYKNDAKASANAAKTSQTSAAGSANTATQAVTTIQGLKSDVEGLKSDTQTIKNSAVTETTKLKDAAAASATQAGNSAAEAGKQATNASTSATAAKKDADRAKTEADRAEAAADNAPEIQPLPDVWIPFNDSLDMITGFSPSYKKIIIGEDEITMPGDKIIKFKRASTATYVNKSGVLTVAEIDEPRFERDGLLIEGQRTNLLLNSTDPSKWNKSSNMILNTTGTDEFGFAFGKFTLKAEMVGQTSAINIVTVAGNKGVDVTGTEKYVTTSCRVQSGTENLRCRIRFENYDGSAYAFLGDAYLNLTDLSIEKTGGAANRITARAVKDEASKWIFFEATIKALDTENMLGSQIQYAPVKGGGTGADDYIYVATPQVEAGSCPSSFIISGTTPTTRASDMVTMPIKNNVSTPPWTCLVEVHRNWSIVPNAAPRIFDTTYHGSGKPFIFAFSGNPDNINYKNVYVDIGDGDGRANRAIITPDYDFICGFRVKENFDVQAVCQSLIGSVAKTNWRYIVESATLRIGGQTTTGERHMFAHIRNLRIWHKALTDRQMKESI
ncbi:tail fiber protein [Enterobacteria phage JenP1]|uniref:Tail fiber protein n=1 Tax=Enterobacteria phage JenP1 TaxID=1610837 RepID=A0A0E3M194_9CAUD|nr:tail protein [Enterobacteria phage JenP1]AKA60889.1 tail fiber protein [Enterobacteria phage JenP1]